MQQLRESNKKNEGNSPADTKVREEGRRDAPSPWMTNGKDIHTAGRRGPHDTAGRCAVKEAAVHGELMPEQSSGRNCGMLVIHAGVVCPEGLYPMKRTTLEQFLNEYRLWEGPTLEQLVKGCILWEEPHAGAAEECEKAGAAESKCCELTVTPLPITSGWHRCPTHWHVQLEFY